MTIEQLIETMTLEEKCTLLAGGSAFSTRAFPHLGIPSLRFADGPHGMRAYEVGKDRLGFDGSLPATCFPTAATVASSWDPALAEELGAALGEEALSQYVDVVLGPGLNIKRSPLCGRNFEYFSEDPLLSGKMAAGYVRGIQSTGASACPKHFAANSQETRRMASDSVVDERTLRELYLSGFETMVKESNPRCVMTSYNLVNGTYVNEDSRLVGDVLRREWGHEGAVVSDWMATHDRAAAVRAGSTFEMPDPGLASVRGLVEAVRSGEVPQEDLDARVREALSLIFASWDAEKGIPYDKDAHHALARRAAAESAVLLKNEGGLLPLAPGTKVALIGDFAETPRYQGAGSSQVNPTRLDTLKDSLKASGLEPCGFACGFRRDGTPDEMLADEACELARQADAVLLCLGLDEARECEGADRTDLALPLAQRDLVGAVAAANPRTVVLLHCGSPVETGWAEAVPSLLWVGLGGQAGASAALDVVTGAVNPSGKLAETWPVSLEDTPTFGRYPADGRRSEYREGLYVGYRYYQTAGVPVAYPFGHGLSYTSFSYSDLGVKVQEDAEGRPTAEVSVTVENTGDRAGSEVAQLYVTKRFRAVFAPERSLAAFAKVSLGPGEALRVTFTVGPRAFSHYNVKSAGWEVEGGPWELRVGGSSEDASLSAMTTLRGTNERRPYRHYSLVPYVTGKVQDVDDACFSALLGRGIEDEAVDKGSGLCVRDLAEAKSPLLRAFAKRVRAAVEEAAAKGAPVTDALFVHNLPLHALPRVTGGRVTPELVKALEGGVSGSLALGLLRSLGPQVRSRSQDKRLERTLQRQARRSVDGD